MTKINYLLGLVCISSFYSKTLGGLIKHEKVMENENLIQFDEAITDSYVTDSYVTDSYVTNEVITDSYVTDEFPNEELYTEIEEIDDGDYSEIESCDDIEFIFNHYSDIGFSNCDTINGKYKL